MKRLEELQSFQRIYAPFSGVITARNTDIGALINSGSSGGATERTVSYRAAGQAAGLCQRAPGLLSGGQARAHRRPDPGGVSRDAASQGKLVRTANAIDPTSRTLLVEIAVDNPTGQLFTGSYAEVHLKLPTADLVTLFCRSILCSSAAEGLRVATVARSEGSS